MNEKQRLSGILAPVLTPFDASLQPCADRLITLCRQLTDQGLALAPFGTTSEANSMAVEEKTRLLSALVDAGIDPQRLLPGTGCCALTDTVALTRHALTQGCAGVLLLPPFYYKAVSDEGLFASVSEVIERVGNSALEIYLYHIPPIAQVGFSADLIERLISRYPHTIVGVKDSSGDWDHHLSLLQRGWPDFRIFAGTERFLLNNLRHGGAGCISATANVNGAALVKLKDAWESDQAQLLQAQCLEVRETFEKFPMIPALKAVVAAATGDATWTTPRPPLLALADPQRQLLLDQLGTLKFEFLLTEQAGR